MIISASRRTDIPSYYSEWFINRIKEEFVYVRNPMNIHQISKISVIVALIINKPIFNIICFGICAGDAVMSILGWISILIFYKKRF